MMGLNLNNTDSRIVPVPSKILHRGFDVADSWVMDVWDCSDGVFEYVVGAEHL
jgi:hypothetical protein